MLELFQTEGGRSPATVRERLTDLAGLLSVAGASGLLLVLPLAGLEFAMVAMVALHLSLSGWPTACAVARLPAVPSTFEGT